MKPCKTKILVTLVVQNGSKLTFLGKSNLWISVRFGITLVPESAMLLLLFTSSLATETFVDPKYLYQKRQDSTSEGCQ
jgi:hypothetical protein